MEEGGPLNSTRTKTIIYLLKMSRTRTKFVQARYFILNKKLKKATHGSINECGKVGMANVFIFSSFLQPCGREWFSQFLLM